MRAAWIGTERPSLTTSVGEVPSQGKLVFNPIQSSTLSYFLFRSLRLSMAHGAIWETACSAGICWSVPFEALSSIGKHGECELESLLPSELSGSLVARAVPCPCEAMSGLRTSRSWRLCLDRPLGTPEASVLTPPSLGTGGRSASPGREPS